MFEDTRNGKRTTSVAPFDQPSLESNVQKAHGRHCANEFPGDRAHDQGCPPARADPFGLSCPVPRHGHHPSLLSVIFAAEARRARARCCVRGERSTRCMSSLDRETRSDARAARTVSSHIRKRWIAALGAPHRSPATAPGLPHPSRRASRLGAAATGRAISSG